MPLDQNSLVERCRAIDALVLDVDGTLTDGRIIYGDDGVESKQFHVRDGSGLKFWSAAGKRAAIVTGRRSEVVSRRAGELGISLVYQGVSRKDAVWAELLSVWSCPGEHVAVVGDDLPDLPLFRRAGLRIAVADAVAEVQQAADYVTRKRGGRGAVREVIELILQAQGRWTSVVEAYGDGAWRQGNPP